MKKSIFKGKSTRTKVFTLITVGIILALLGINYLLTYIGIQRAWYVDLTPEGLYSLSDEMIEECSDIAPLNEGDKKLKIIFCSDPDTLMENTVTRIVYLMSLQMQKEFENVEVETLNVIYEPTKVAQFRVTSLTEFEPTNIIISYGDTYRITDAESFWTVTSEDSYFSYNGEYKLATIIMSVTAVNKPVAYFSTGHGETYFDPDNKENSTNHDAEQLYYLLLERGLDVKTIDLTDPAVEEIPEDCKLLIINNPTVDFDLDYDEADRDKFFYVTETEKVDRYLREDQGAVMVTKDYAITLSNLENFLFGWGFDFSTYRITDDVNNAGKPNEVLGVYETNTDSYANAIYGEFASRPSAPHTVYTNTGYISCSFYLTDRVDEPGANNVSVTYNPFMKSYTTAVASKDGSSIDEVDVARDLAAVSVRYALDSYTNEAEYSYVFCANSAEFLSNELLSDGSIANFDMVSALVNNISRTDIYASTDLGGTSMNSSKYGGKQLVYDVLSDVATTIYNSDATIKGTTKALTDGVTTALVVISCSVPAVLLVIGAAVRIRRRYL